MIKKYFFYLIALIAVLPAFSQLPNPAVVGYWENWNGSKFVKLKNIDSRYNVIHIAFAALKSGTDYELYFTPPSNYTDSVFKSEIKFLQNQGKKVCISIGGQNDHVMLDTEEEKNTFVSSVTKIIDDWEFDGLDIDLEGASLNFDTINIQKPGKRLTFMITAIKEIMAQHQTKYGKKLLLTMAPETAYVQGALSPWAGKYRGAYLPIIEALKDSIDMLNVQLYNSGSMYGLEGQTGPVFSQGKADFVLAMTEAVIHGFKATGEIGTYSGFPASKVGVGLPGCHSSDAVPHKELELAMRYLLGKGAQPSNYKLKQEGGYPELRGMMTWSINSDRTCTPSYGYIDTWSKIFTKAPYIEISNSTDIFEQNEAGGVLEVNLFNDTFSSTLDTANWSVENLPEGVAVDSIVRVNDSLAQIVLKGNSISEYNMYIWDIGVTVQKNNLVNSDTSLIRKSGVLLKKNAIKIPGIIQGEAYRGPVGTKNGKNWETDGGRFLTLWKSDHADYKVEVTDSGRYVFELRVATNNQGSREVILKLNGRIKVIKGFSSTTGYKNWETVKVECDLPKGEHDLTIFMSSGWMSLDKMEVQVATSSNLLKTEGIPNISFFPNPASESIQFTGAPAGSLSIVDLKGKTVKQIGEIPANGKVQVSDLQQGLYLIKLISHKGEVSIAKLLIK